MAKRTRSFPDPEGNHDPWHDTIGRGKLANNVPFRPDLRLGARKLLVPLVGDSALKPSRLNDALSALLANALYAAGRGPEAWVFYSRDRNHYASFKGTARTRFYSRDTMVAAVDVLVRLGLIRHLKTAPSQYAELRSRIQATAALIELGVGIKAADFAFDPSPAVVLRDKGGQPVHVHETRRLRLIRRDVEDQNAFLERFTITVDPAVGRYDDRGFLYAGDRWFNPLRRRYYRVFNGDFRRGGRWYGPYWQSLSAQARKAILINGEPTVELDYRTCHPRLLCAIAGLVLPFDDPDFDFYGGKGVKRKQNKLAFNLALNARDERTGIAAISQKFREEGWPCRYLYVRAVLRRLTRRHPELARYFNTGIGLRLQNIDAQMCAEVQRRLREQGVPCLSVHDSFIVPETYTALLKSTMSGVLDVEVFKLRQQKYNQTHRKY
jgi:hypothetical protein